MANNISKIGLNSTVYSIAGGDIYESLGISAKRFTELLSRDFYVPTMPSAPTEDTLTYVDTDLSVNDFRIGQQCRVADSDSDEGYTFYMLYDIKDGKAVWAAGGGGGGDVREKVRITLNSNQTQPDESLVGATVVVYDNTLGQEVYSGTWGGEGILCKITPLNTYTVTVGSVEGYSTPASQTYEAGIQGDRIVAFTYNTCLLSVNLTTNQSDHSDITGAKVTVSYGSVIREVSSGSSVKVPMGVSATVTASDVAGYRTPSAVTFTAGTASKEVSMAYNTCVLTVNIGGLENGETVQATVSYGSQSDMLQSGGSVKVPYGEEVTVSVPDVEGYGKPSAYVFTPSETSKTVQMDYVASALKVTIDSNQTDKTDLSGAKVTVSWNGGSLEAASGETVGIPVNTPVTVTYPEIEGYKTPDAQTLTNTGGLVEKTGTYYTEIVTVSVGSDNGTSMNGVTVTVDGEAFTYDGTSIVKKVAYGKAYSVSVSDKDLFVTPSAQNFTASQASRSVAMTYKYSALKVTIDSNQSDKSDLSGLKATVAYGSTSVQVSSGETVGIPLNTNVTVTFPSLSGYKTPDSITFTNTGGLVEKTGTYYTEVLTVSVSADNSADMNGTQVVINGETVTYSGSSIVRKIPYGTQYTVQGTAKDGYTTPVQQTFTASQASRSVSMVWVYNPIIYSYITLNQTITDPETMLSGDINGEAVQAIRANSHRVLAKKTADGVVTYCRLNDANSTQYHDGTSATLTTAGTDVMLKLPEFYWQCVQTATDVFKIGLAYGGNPGNGWKKWEGDKALLGAYEAYNNSSKVYSCSGQISTGNVSQAEFKIYARNRGTGYSIVTWEWHCMMAMLYYCQYGHTNSQMKIGAGMSSYDKISGLSNSLGMTDTWGNKDYTQGTGNDGPINFWGIENWWGNKYEWIDNIVVNARSWVITPMDGSASRTAGTGGSSNGFSSKMILGEHFDMIPTAVSGSETTGYCDYYYQSSSGSRVVRRSSYVSSTSGGVACADADVDSSYAGSDAGSRLAFYGTLVEAESVSAFKAL